MRSNRRLPSFLFARKTTNWPKRDGSITERGSRRHWGRRPILHRSGTVISCSEMTDVMISLIPRINNYKSAVRDLRPRSPGPHFSVPPLFFPLRLGQKKKSEVLEHTWYYVR